jgi:hypothetical protein
MEEDGIKLLKDHVVTRCRNGRRYYDPAVRQAVVQRAARYGITAVAALLSDDSDPMQLTDPAVLNAKAALQPPKNRDTFARYPVFKEAKVTVIDIAQSVQSVKQEESSRQCGKRCGRRIAV